MDKPKYYMTIREPSVGDLRMLLRKAYLEKKELVLKVSQIFSGNSGGWNTDDIELEISE